MTSRLARPTVGGHYTDYFRYISLLYHTPAAPVTALASEPQSANETGSIPVVGKNQVGQPRDRIRGVSTILIAEQDLFLRQQLADFFRQHGHDVTEAGDGVEATQQLEHYLFELILTDLYLPGCNGIQILQAAQAHDHFTPVLILIDPEELSGAVEALKLGAHDYLVKQHPIRLEEVHLRVERALECRSMLQAIAYLKRVQHHTYDCERTIRHSVHLQHLLGRLQRDIDTGAHVLITGSPELVRVSWRRRFMPTAHVTTAPWSLSTARRSLNERWRVSFLATSRQPSPEPRHAVPVPSTMPTRERFICIKSVT